MKFDREIGLVVTSSSLSFSFQCLKEERSGQVNDTGIHPSIVS